jgi:hypothetical protein
MALLEDPWSNLKREWAWQLWARAPDVGFSDALAWGLRRAFAPLDSQVIVPANPFDALEEARRFDLLDRIVSRVPSVRLLAELGEAGAREAACVRLDALARSGRLTLTYADLATIAEATSVPLLYLKGAALRLSGVTVEGSRAACDVDVLVPQTGAERFRAALIDSGYRGQGLPDAAHQLGPLSSPNGVTVEVHLCVPGVYAEGASPARFEDLVPGLAERLPGRGWIPTRPVLRAHALVHGLVQHGAAPLKYPQLRTLADLMDLGLECPLGSPAPVDTPLSAREVTAALQLARELAHGTPPQRIVGPEGRLLRHIVAGIASPEYASKLKWQGFLARPRSGTWRGLGRDLAYVLAPTDAQLKRIYGGEISRARTVWLRATRPFDLLNRLSRSWVNRARLR